MRQATALSLLVLTAGLSGCLGLGGDEDPATAADASTNSGELGTTPDGSPIALDDGVVATIAGHERIHEVLWFNGTFEVHQSADVSGATWLAGEPHPGHVTHDISDRVPTGVPAVIAVEVNAETTDGDIDVWFNMPNEEVWAANFDTPYGGFSEVRYAIVRGPGSPVTAELFYDELDTSTSFDYTMRVDIWSHPEWVPAGLPLALQLPGAGTQLTFEHAPDAEDPSVLLYGPSDELVGRYAMDAPTLTVELPEDAPPGEYVYMFVAGSLGGRVNVSAPGVDAVSPRTLTQEIVFTDTVPIPRGETAGTLTFDTPSNVLQVGFGSWGADVAKDFHGVLTGPAGTVLELAVVDDPWVQAGFGLNTGMGDQHVVGGTYEASVEWGAALGVQQDVVMQGWSVHFGR